MIGALIFPAFLAGLFTFLAPCTLPLVPGYLSFISGVSKEELQDRKKARKIKRKIFLNGVFFVLGFSLIFITFGTLAGFLGELLANSRNILSRLGGVLIIVFGLLMTGFFNIPLLEREIRFKKIPLSPGNPFGSFAVGAAFAFGWTPCVGPVLGSILLLTTTSATALEGGFLLLIFSLGLAVPFLLVAGAISQASDYINKFSGVLRVISVVGGLFLVLIGLLLATGNFGLLIQYGYKIFDFINYDAILNFL
jgi:cytochrome c-type biogenesis protein